MTKLQDVIDQLVNICIDGLLTDGAHHKQDALKQILMIIDPEELKGLRDQLD